VEEDSSLFTFKERYAMVLAGTKDLPNVKVVPSGNFILSQTTFPEYFIKVEDEDLAHNTEYDITLFAEAIAPKLNITYRFVGEEQTDKVTDAYNLAMKKILPEYGIQLVEIPRKKAGGEVISATTVRERLEHFMEENITDFIPESTRNLLVQSC
jgi:citrate lyase synthetase